MNLNWNFNKRRIFMNFNMVKKISFFICFFVLKWGIPVVYTQAQDTYTQTQDTYIQTQAQDTYTQTQDTYTQTQNTYTQTQNTYTQTQNTYTQTQNTYTQTQDTYIQTQDTPTTTHPTTTKPTTTKPTKTTVAKSTTTTKSTRAKPSNKTLILTTGESIKIPSPSFENIRVSQAGIVSVQDFGSSLHVYAKKEGAVLINLGPRLYKIHVVKKEQKQNILILNELLSNRMGLKTHFENKQIHVKGKLHRTKDFIDLSQTAHKHHIPWLFSADTNPALQKKLNQYIQTQLQKTFARANLPLPVLSWQKPLTAFVPNEKNLARLYKKQTQYLGIEIQTDPSLLPSPPQIKLKILMVESSSDHSFQTHIDWGEESTLTRLLNKNTFINIINEFKSMENKGTAQIISETSLLTESGKKSHFHSGGEAPIPYYNPETGAQGMRWKPYGIRLNFTTQSDRNNKIHLKTQVEISEVDHAHSARSAPSLKVSRIHSSITMQNGQSLLLSKLIRKRKGKTRSAPMDMFRLPLIGNPLSLKGKIKEQTRLYIFITSHFVGRLPMKPSPEDKTSSMMKPVNQISNTATHKIGSKPMKGATWKY